MKRVLAFAVLGLVAELSALAGAAGAQTFCVWSSPGSKDWYAPGWERQLANWHPRRDGAYHEIFGDRPRSSGRRRRGSGRKSAAAGAPATPAATAPSPEPGPPLVPAPEASAPPAPAVPAADGSPPPPPEGAPK